MKRERYTKITDFIGDFFPVYAIDEQILQEPEYASVWPKFREAYLKRVRKAPHRTAKGEWTWVFGEINMIIFSNEALPKEVSSGRLLWLLRTLKQIDFQTNHRNVREVHLELNGIICGQYHLRRTDENILIEISQNGWNKTYIIPPQGTASTQLEWRAIHTEEWKTNYRNRNHRSTHMPLLWKLEVQYDGMAKKTYRGKNAFPVSFWELLSFFGMGIS